VQCDRQLDHAEVRPEVPTRPAHLPDQLTPDLLGQVRQDVGGQFAQVLGPVQPGEQPR
jgi:hypothetical protein